MACTDNTGSYVNIKELPEINDVVAGDFLIIETARGTNILDFNNFIIPIENTTFGSVILNNTSNIAILSSDFISTSTDLQSQLNNLNTSVNYILTAANLETYATFSIGSTTGNNPTITIFDSSNISGSTWNPDISAVKFTFKNNYYVSEGNSNPPYGCVATTVIGNNIGISTDGNGRPLIDLTSASIAVRDSSNKATAVLYATFKVVGGTLA